MSERLNVIAQWFDVFTARSANPQDESMLDLKVAAEVARFFSSASAEESSRQRRAALEVCIWVAHADALLHEDEQAILERLIGQSGLAWKDQQALFGAARRKPDIDEIATRLTDPGLRKAIYGVARKIVRADGEVHDDERSALAQLRAALEIGDVEVTRSRGR